jgi:hypothetical protein
VQSYSGQRQNIKWDFRGYAKKPVHAHAKKPAHAVHAQQKFLDKVQVVIALSHVIITTIKC